jgi:uncharacterized membrane protein YphA (DoxX/SURF4 family)
MKNSRTTIFLFLIRVVLSVTFIYASYHKIENPAGFAKILYGYDIFPNFAINLLAIYIPFLELAAGFCLLFNVLPGSSLLLINSLLAGFILAIGYNLLRGHTFDCGCFSISSQNHSASNIFLLVRDILMLAAGAFLWKKTTAS